MANPTLTKGSGTFTTSGTAVLQLYNAQRESPRKSSNIIPLPLPASTSDETLAFDLLGVSREITVEGFFTGSDGNYLNFTADLDGLQNGAQGNTGGGQTGYSLQLHTRTAPITVYVNECSWEGIAGEPDKLTYSITFLEVSSSSE